VCRIDYDDSQQEGSIMAANVILIDEQGKEHRSCVARRLLNPDGIARYIARCNEANAQCRAHVAAGETMSPEYRAGTHPFSYRIVDYRFV